MNNITLRKKQFIRFLKENNCYGNFIFNLENHKQYIYSYKFNNVDDIVKETINRNNNLVNEFTCAFSWTNTIEGYRYWANKSYQWNKHNW